MCVSPIPRVSVVGSIGMFPSVLVVIGISLLVRLCALQIRVAVFKTLARDCCRRIEQMHA